MQLDISEHSLKLKARSSITIAFVLWYIFDHIDFTNEACQADKLFARLKGYSPPLSLFGLTAAASLAAFVLLPPTHPILQDTFQETYKPLMPELNASLFGGTAAPSVWLAKFMAVCSNLPDSYSAQESKKVLQQSLPEGQEHQKSFDSKDRCPPGMSRLLMMVTMLKTIALLTCIAYLSKNVKAALASLWHMLGKLVQQGVPDHTSESQAVNQLDCELSGSMLVAELTVPLLRQCVTAHKAGSESDTTTNLLGASVSCDILCSRLECTSPEMRHAVASQLVKQGMLAARSCSKCDGLKPLT